MPGITDPTEAYFKDGQWGWDGTQWRKLAMVWGYSDRYYELESWIGDGISETGSTDAVPPGYIYIVDRISARDADSAPSSIVVYAYETGGGYVVLGQDTSPAAGKYLIVGGPTVLKEGDYITADFFGTTNLDKFDLRVWGYKMAIAE